MDDRDLTPPAPQPALVQTCGNPLQYQKLLAGMIEEERQQELDRLDQELESSDSYCTVLHLAIMLSTPAGDVQNDSKSIKLYEKVQTMEAVSVDDMDFTIVNLNHLRQRQDLRNRIGAYDKELQANKKQNKNLQQQITVLQSQIEQLKSLEVEIGKKEQSVIAPAAE
ncbi:MAG: hypothetical protein KDJ38_09435 [Gammaproteobacteria bacterium]|nr:hypothetical protein [Gammaproteobacteria bacterium]